MHVGIAHRHALQPLIRLQRVQHEGHAHARDCDQVRRKQEGRPREARGVIGQAPRGLGALRLRAVGEQFEEQRVRVMNGEIARQCEQEIELDASEIGGRAGALRICERWMSDGARTKQL